MSRPCRRRCAWRAGCQANTVLFASRSWERWPKSRAPLRLCALAAALAAVACGGDDSEDTAPPALVDAPELEFPPTLSQVGLYQDMAERKPSARALPYEPRAALWSNGLAKERFIVVPEGEAIDADGAEWEFPENTLLFKTFLGDAGPVETRVVRTKDGAAEFAAYRWDGDEAVLLDGLRGVDVVVPLEGGSTEHEIPSTRSCEQCHESSPSPVLGFSPLQLSGAKGAAQKQVERLVADGAFPAAPRLDAALDRFDGDELAVLSYFVGNCVHCHNDSGGIASSFDLSPAVALEAIIDQPTTSSASAVGIRVVPGDASASVLFQAVSGETDDPEVKSMPPVGVQRRDEAAIELLRDWINGL